MYTHGHVSSKRIAMSKTVPLSVRITDDDATFLTSLDIADAKTPSEKLRAILARERRRSEGTQDPVAAVDLVQDMLRPAHRRVRRCEEDGRRSDLVHKAYGRVPEIAGLLMAGPASDDPRSLAEFESRLAEKIASLSRDFMELGLFSHSRCYGDEAVKQNLPSLIELVELLSISNDRRKDRT
jgi:hypothetical protein